MQFVAGTIGGFIGFFLGGPAGAAIGFSIGMGIGMGFESVQVPGQKLGEISGIKTDEGGPRVIPFGKLRPIGGQLLAIGDPNIVTTTVEQGGKGGPSITSSYDTVYRSYAIGVCEGPITKFLRIWRNNKLVYDNRGTEWGAANNAEFLKYATLYLGEYDQLPNSALETIYGSGNVPAYRGTVYIVMDQDDVTDFGGAVPQYLFEVLRAYTTEIDITPSYWYLYLLSRGGTMNKLLNGDQSENSWEPAYNIPNEGADYTGMVIGPNGDHYATSSGTYGKIKKREYGTTTWVDETTVGNLSNSWQDITADDDGNIYATLYKLGIWKKAVGDSAFRQLSVTPDPPYTWSVITAYSIVWENGKLWIGSRWGGGHGVFVTSDNGGLLVNKVGGIYGTNAVIYDPESTFYYYSRELAGGAQMYVSQDGGNNWGYLQSLASGWYPLCYDACLGWDRSIWFSAWTRLYRKGPEEEFFVNMGAQYGFSQPVAITAEYVMGSIQETTLPYWELSGILTEICERAGLPEEYLNFDLLEDKIVYGFSYSQAYPAYTAIEGLARVFFFDVSDYDGQLYFISRGMDITDQLETDDLVDDGQTIKEANKQDSIIVPKVMHLEYLDIDGGLSPDKQSSERSQTGNSVSEITTQTIVILDADQAKQAVAVNHKVNIEEAKGGYKFSLGDNYLRLVPGQVIALDGIRLRITEIEIEEGFQKYKASIDRQSAYDITNVSGIPVESPAEPPCRTIGPTTFQFIDCHILKDQDDENVGYYVAISGEGCNWKGAYVEYSLDGGSNYIQGMTGRKENVMGELITDLPAHSEYYPDEINTVTVRLLNEDMELTASDLAGMMNRENLALIGTEDSAGMQDEIINFANAEQDSNGDWVLSYFLRGRKGSAAVEHLAGERFVMLQRPNLYFIPVDIFTLNKDITFRITSLGSASDTSIETHTFRGLSQTERQPAYLKAARNGGNLIISWQGVGRIGGGVYIDMGKFFESFLVTVNGTEYETTEETITVTDPGGSVTISVQQVNSITGAGPEIQVII